MRRKRIVRLALLVVTLAIAAPTAAVAEGSQATAASAAPEVAAVSCTGIACNGKDPQASGCSADGRTLEDITVGSLRLEMRYSNACAAAWTRTTVIHSYCCYSDVSEIRAYGARGVHLRTYRKAWPYPTGSNWTAMAGNNTTVKGYRSCAVEWQSYVLIECSPLHAA